MQHDSMRCNNPCAGGFTLFPCFKPNKGGPKLSFSCFSICCTRSFGQIALAPGCVVPGRSLIALFVNTAALLWFFCYLLFILYSSWEVSCPFYNPGTDFSADPIGWLTSGAPTPIHWLLLLFAITGACLTVVSFVSDLFTGPKPPPRSYYEAALWRGRRQVKVIGCLILLAACLGWGLALVYFTLHDNGCATQGSDRPLQSLYNVAYLLVLLMLVVFGLVLVLGCCVCCDCFLSGRVKMVLLLSDAKYEPPAAEQYHTGGIGDGAETLVPGVPARQQRSQYGTADESFFVGAVEESQSRLFVSSTAQQPGATWSSAGPKLPPAPRR